MLIMTAVALFIAVLIARRAVAFIPMGEGMSTWLEESAEVVAHLFWLATVFADLWPRPSAGRVRDAEVHSAAGNR